MKTLNELDLLASSASDIIQDLVSFAEITEDPEMEDRIAKANEWLSWHAGEFTHQDAQSVCRNLTGYKFIPLEDTHIISKEVWETVIHNFNNLCDMAEEFLPNYTTNNRIGEINDMWKKLEDLGLYNK